jgi:hypothetical protein
MFERIFSLLERLVIAIELIAAAGERPILKDPEAISSRGPTILTPNPQDYESMEHEVLKALCEKREIELKPRLKKPTLIKLLQTWDIQNASLPAKTTTETGAGVDPFEEASTTEKTDQAGNGGTGDFFGDSAEVEKPPTVDDVREALKVYHQTKGEKAFYEMLNPFGVKKIKDIPEEKYAAVIAAAKL